ncbi:MAG TPA: Hsp20/alpha crystallin family protein [Chitinophagaceae bacterium]|nr:Hsp20/alpha crystallin family protein [Chitinophagaceae bacterium]
MITLTKRYQYAPNRQTRPGPAFSGAWHGADGREHFRAPQSQPVPVNFRESQAGCRLDLVVPGFSREDFQIQVDRNLLTITATARPLKDPEPGRYQCLEYQPLSFKREFTQDERLDVYAAQASYFNGILTLNLPFSKPVKEQTVWIDVN